MTVSTNLDKLLQVVSRSLKDDLAKETKEQEKRKQEAEALEDVGKNDDWEFGGGGRKGGGGFVSQCSLETLKACSGPTACLQNGQHVTGANINDLV
jgi:hypothetical protein